MNDIAVEAWSSLVTARAELTRAELELDAAMQGLDAAPPSEKTSVTRKLEDAFARIRSARSALQVAESNARGPLSGGR